MWAWCCARSAEGSADRRDPGAEYVNELLRAVYLMSGPRTEPFVRSAEI